MLNRNKLKAISCELQHTHCSAEQVNNAVITVKLYSFRGAFAFHWNLKKFYRLFSKWRFRCSNRSIHTAICISKLYQIVICQFDFIRYQFSLMNFSVWIIFMCYAESYSLKCSDYWTPIPFSLFFLSDPKLWPKLFFIRILPRERTTFNLVYFYWWEKV